MAREADILSLVGQRLIKGADLRVRGLLFRGGVLGGCDPGFFYGALRRFGHGGRFRVRAERFVVLVQAVTRIAVNDACVVKLSLIHI